MSAKDSVPHRGSRWRAVLSAVLIVLGAVLAPVGLVANWARVQLTDTDVFVSTFGPLAKDPAVQELVTRQTVAAIDSHLNVSNLASSAVDGIASLGLGPRSTAALRSLEGAAVAGVKNLIRDTVHDVVTSPRFASTWATLLRGGHAQLVKSMRASPAAVVAVDERGTLSLQLGPVVEAVKQRLVADGVTLAERIPHVDRTVVLAQSGQAATARRVYRLVVGVGGWLLAASFALLVAGVLLARRTEVAILGAAVALAVTMALILTGLGVGRAIVSASGASGDAVRVVYDRVAADIAGSSIAIAAACLAVALIAWFVGSSRPATRLRAALASVPGRLRRQAA